MGHQAQDGARSESEESRLDRLEGRLDKLVALLETMVAGAPETGPPSAAAALTPDSFLPASERKADIIRPTSFPKARARFARETIRRRRKREEYFPAELFSDACWDILLDLYAAHYEGEAVSISSLCIAASVPQTTALRWIALLTNEGWLVRWADPNDRRRSYIKLSDRARGRLDAYFDDLPY
ncbi:winged helix DNA-binding protein [Sphingopyxis macrogoltabida]|nr:winged helix DNA-binding protein [Sphingopyxis macrogoltabida]ALJ15215.1 hypothetical protein LH19_20265 [Sphingopyxis macrogoltabida]